ncbi:MAG: SH3 domain-containing protein [Roseobacter sp.]
MMRRIDPLSIAAERDVSARILQWLMLGFAALSLCLTMTAAAAQDDMRVEHIRFPAGATGTTIEGQINGRESVLYRLGGEAGQVMNISLTSNNTATYFNVYAPGSAPGDEALAAGTLTGPLMPDLNRFSGPLPVSGEYSVSVYLYRNAARRGETSDYTLDFSITGETGEIVQGDFADGLQGGPDYWAVRTSGGTLNLRESASAGAGLVTRLANGTPLRNLGCRMAEGRRWCRVATLSDPGFEGWVAGDFLVEGSGQGAATQLPDMIPVPADSEDAVVPGTAYHATGSVECVRRADAVAQSCAFGVTRQGNGTGAVTIEWPEGGSRTIFFEAGTPVSYDQSQADRGREMTVSRDGDTTIIFIGDARFVIPDAIVWGG